MVWKFVLFGDFGAIVSSELPRLARLHLRCYMPANCGIRAMSGRATQRPIRNVKG